MVQRELSILDVEDAAQLAEYLERTGRVEPGSRLQIEVLKGGVSCATVRVARPDGPDWVIKQALPRLRVDVEWLSDPARIHHEAMAMEWLATVVPDSVPGLVFEDQAELLVAMDAVPTPHERWKDLLLAGNVMPDHVEQFGKLLATIHTRAMEQEAELSSTFADRSFYESLRLEPYYAYSATREPAAAPFLSQLIDDTRATLWTVVHGDYSPKNVLVRNGRLVLLDHEVIHWGDGGFDIGFAMAHFLAKSHYVAGHQQRFRDAANLFWKSYRNGGADLLRDPAYERRVVRHSIGCTLARAVGRSKLEYLSADQTDRQARVTVALTGDPPATVAELVRAFAAEIDRLG